MKSLARKLLDGIFVCEKTLTCLGFAVMALALIADVLSREFLGTGIFGAPRVGVYGMIAVAFLGIGVASHTGSHLRPRFTDALSPKSWDPILERLGDAIFALFCLGMAAITVSVAQVSYDFREVSPVLMWPIWPFQGIIAAAFGIGVVRHSIYALYPELRPIPQSDRGPETSE